jgi:hypothetical protein
MKGHKTTCFVLLALCFFGCSHQEQKSKNGLDEINSFTTIGCPFCDGSDKDCPNCKGNKKTQNLKTGFETQ